MTWEELEERKAREKIVNYILIKKTLINSNFYFSRAKKGRETVKHLDFVLYYVLSNFVFLCFSGTSSSI